MAENYGSLEGVLDANETLEGEIDSHDEMSGEIQFAGGVGGVKDVQVNNESVVDANKVAHIDLTPYAEKEDVYDKQTIDTALEGKADTDDIPTELSDLQDDADHRTVTDAEKTEWSGKSNVSANPSITTETLTGIEIDGTAYAIPSGGSGDVADVKVNGISVVDPVTKEAEIDLSGYAETSDIPTDLADLSDDATHRLVTDTEKSTWDNKADVSDIPTVNNNTITIQKNGQNIDSFTLNQNSNKAINISVPTKTSDLQNDNSFITNTVNNLANYYLKSQTYTQAEVDALIDAAVNGRFQKVNVLPATGEPNIIYLVPKATPETSNACDEYIWQDNDWELIGSTDIDLSGYVTDDELNTALADYLTTSAFNTAIANYYTKTEIGTLLDGKVDKETGKGLSTNDYDNTAKGIVDGVTAALADKVDKVTGKGLSTNDYTTTEKNKVATIDNKADKVTNATNGNLAGLDANGNLTDSGLAATTIVHKADKVSGQVAGHLASLSGTGNLTDSGWNGAKDTTSISGNPISISGLKANQLAVNPIITLEPIQAGSGTPSPVNQRPISGYDKIEVSSCGVNIWDEQWELGSLDMDTGEKITNTGLIRTKNYIGVIPNKEMRCIAPLGIIICYYDRNYRYLSEYKDTPSVINPSNGSIFTVPSNANYMLFRMPSGYGTTYANNVSINIPSSDTSYHASNKTTDLSESFGQTVYGGTLDVRTGKLVVDTGFYTFTGQESWTIYNSAIAYTTLSSMKSGLNMNGVCSKLEVGSANGQLQLGNNNSIVYLIGIAIYNLTTSNDVQAFMTGVQLAHPINPFTIQLTPHEISLLKDYAYVSTNGTSIALDYHNGELASLADVSQLGETVNELGDYVGANNLGSQNAIVIPETGNFICPSDGYVVVRSGNNASDFYRVDVYGSQKVSTNRIIIKVNSTPDTSSKYQYFSVYVRKGMIVTFGEKSSGNTTGGANFVTIE